MQRQCAKTCGLCEVKDVKADFDVLPYARALNLPIVENKRDDAEGSGSK